MGRRPATVIEYRSYELPSHFPMRIIAGEDWRISDVPCGVLHFHNCLEIGLCESDGGKIDFAGHVEDFHAGDVTVIAGDVPHTTWSDAGTASKWAYLFCDPEELLRPFLHWIPCRTPACWMACCTAGAGYFRRSKTPPLHRWCARCCAK